MELTKEQIQQIDNYISICGIKYYDVKMEIVDHFASKLEERLVENPNLDFKEAIVEEHKRFSKNGFSSLISSKEKSTQKRFLKISLQHLKTFFKLPKIIITLFSFFFLYKIMSLFDDKKFFFDVLTITGFIIFAQLGLRIVFFNRKKKTNFLILNRTNLFLQIVNNAVVWFHLFGTFRKEVSFENNQQNIIHLAVFVIMILGYWSMEYVYQQNRKEVQKQYPNVLV